MQGLFTVYWLAHAEPIKQFLSKSCLSKLGCAIFVFFGALLTIAFDVLVFLFDLGWRMPFIDQHAESYRIPAI